MAFLDNMINWSPMNVPGENFWTGGARTGIPSIQSAGSVFGGFTGQWFPNPGDSIFSTGVAGYRKSWCGYITFNGTSQYATTVFSEEAVFDFASGAFTFLVAFKVLTTAQMFLFSKGVNGAQYELLLDSDGSVWFGTGAALRASLPAGSVVAGVWYLLVVRNGNGANLATLDLKMAGASAFTTASGTGTTIVAGGGALTIALRDNGIGFTYYSGSMQHLIVWSRRITDAEVLAAEDLIGVAPAGGGGMILGHPRIWS